MELVMELDRTMLEKVDGYYVYRSQETQDERPVVDGLYLRRSAVGGDPRESIRLSISWD
jgi:hypothetical protein